MQTIEMQFTVILSAETAGDAVLAIHAALEAAGAQEIWIDYAGDVTA